jgi:tetratricopeptide (TPR) repeat protein
MSENRQADTRPKKGRDLDPEDVDLGDAEDEVEDEEPADLEEEEEDDDSGDESGEDDDELGYSEVDWDSLPEKEVDKHNEIRAKGVAELDKLKTARLSDFCRWAVARAYLDQGQDDKFHENALPLVSSKKRSPALDYTDILLAIVSRCAKRGAFEEAFALLGELGELAPDEPLLERRFRALLTIQSGDKEAGLELLAQLAEERADSAAFLLSIGEDLCGLGLFDEALEYLEVAEDQARKSNDQELLASVEYAVQFAQRHIGYDDVLDGGR